MRVTVIATAVCMSIVGLSLADDVRASIRQPTNIPAQPLAPALQRLAKDRNFQIVYVSEEIGDRRTAGAVGEYTPEEALKQLLAGTGLTYKYLDDNTITIVSPTVESAAQAPRQSRSESGDASTRSHSQDESKEAQSSSFWERFHLAQAPRAGAAQPAAVAQAASQQTPQNGPVELQEVVVTAQKRQQRLIDVPIAVSVVDVNSLLESNQTQLHEYFNQIPGLALAQNTSGSSIVSIRGITTGLNQNPTVGFTLDDIPLGASTSGGGGGLVPEVNPADLARVEVLKGPQGSLYGASSMGGLIRYVTVDPTADELFGSVQAGTEAVHNGDGLGYNAYGAINVPLSNTLAVRGSGFVRESPGYVDDVETGRRGVNKEQITGGRVSALWNLPADFTLKLGVLIENDDRDGANDVYVPTPGFAFTSGLHGLQQYTFSGTGQYDRRIRVYSAALNGKIGGVQIAAISGYNVNSESGSADFSYAFGTPADGVPFPNAGKTDKFTQEVRFSTAVGSQLEFLLGGFYTHEVSSFHQALLAVNRATNALDATIFYSNAPVKYKETAGFGAITWRPTEQFDVQVGGRYSHLTVDTLPNFESGSLLPGPLTNPESVGSANVFTYLVSPEYKITRDLMVYGRVANGYRPGGGQGNPLPDALCVQHQFQCSYQPDKTTDYELGIKGTFLDHMLSLDASAFYIDWKNLQLNLIADNTWAYTGNGSRAKSEGIEVSAELHPVDGLTLSGWISWDDAALTRALPAGQDVGLAGDRLPYSSKFSGSLSAQEDFPIVADVRGDIGIKVTYVGGRLGEFTSSEIRQELSAYAQTDLHAGVTYLTWRGTLYANNITDARGALLGGIGSAYPFAFDYIQPRTIGLTISKKL